MTNRTMLYRPGNEVNPACWNEKIDYQIVDDADIETALKDGWYRNPVDFPAQSDLASLSALDENAADLIAAIPEMTKAELQAMLDGEKVGKNRKGLMAALEKALV